MRRLANGMLFLIVLVGIFGFFLLFVDLSFVQSYLRGEVGAGSASSTAREIELRVLTDETDVAEQDLSLIRVALGELDATMYERLSRRGFLWSDDPSTGVNYYYDPTLPLATEVSSVSSSTAGTLVAGTNGLLLERTSSGEPWAQLKLPDRAVSADFIKTYLRDDGYALALTEDGEVFQRMPALNDWIILELFDQSDPFSVPFWSDFDTNAGGDIALISWDGRTALLEAGISSWATSDDGPNPDEFYETIFLTDERDLFVISDSALWLARPGNERWQRLSPQLIDFQQITDIQRFGDRFIFTTAATVYRVSINDLEQSEWRSETGLFLAVRAFKTTKQLTLVDRLGRFVTIRTPDGIWSEGRFTIPAEEDASSEFRRIILLKDDTGEEFSSAYFLMSSGNIYLHVIDTRESALVFSGTPLDTLEQGREATFPTPNPTVGDIPVLSDLFALPGNGFIGTSRSNLIFSEDALADLSFDDVEVVFRGLENFFKVTNWEEGKALSLFERNTLLATLPENWQPGIQWKSIAEPLQAREEGLVKLISDNRDSIASLSASNFRTDNQRVSGLTSFLNRCAEFDFAAAENGSRLDECVSAYETALSAGLFDAAYSELIANLAPAGLLLFLLATLGSGYRYNQRLASFYFARADALEIYQWKAKSGDSMQSFVKTVTALTELTAADRLAFREVRTPVDMLTGAKDELRKWIEASKSSSS
ncbi:MAG: hypothetical protein AAGA63_13615 [Pseudomonadota bacterium]